MAFNDFSGDSLLLFFERFDAFMFFSTFSNRFYNNDYLKVVMLVSRKNISKREPHVGGTLHCYVSELHMSAQYLRSFLLILCFITIFWDESHDVL